MHFFFATDALKRSDAAERADVRQRVAQMHGCVACLVDIKKYFPELVLDAAKVTRMPFSKKVLTFMRENLQPHHVPDVYIPCPYDRDRNCDFYQFDYTKGVKVDVEEAIAFAHIFWDGEALASSHVLFCLLFLCTLCVFISFTSSDR